MNAFIRLLYSLLIAVAVVTFVGVGIYSFYQPPKTPDYARGDRTYISVGQPGYTEQQAEIKAEQKANQELREEHQNEMKTYYRNIAIVALPITAILLAVGVVLLKRAKVVGEGIALGGIATAIYAITVASMSGNRALRFIAVTLFLVGALAITHRRFISDK